MNKRISVFSIIIALCLVAYFSVPIKLSKIRDRDQTFVLDKELEERIQEETYGMCAKEIVKYGMKLTAKLLHYSNQNNISAGKTHCVGYARVYAAICNYAFTLNSLNCKARPVVGHVYVAGVNMCSALSSVVPNKWKNFVKDHDFVEFIFPDMIFYQDACIYDITRRCARTKYSETNIMGE